MELNRSSRFYLAPWNRFGKPLSFSRWKQKLFLWATHMGYHASSIMEYLCVALKPAQVWLVELMIIPAVIQTYLAPLGYRQFTCRGVSGIQHVSFAHWSWTGGSEPSDLC